MKDPIFLIWKNFHLPLDQGLILLLSLSLFFTFFSKNSRMEIARHKETQLQPLFPLHSRGYISRSRIPLLPFDFPASCVHPRIHEAVRVPVGKGLKVDEPKLFTWTDLARTNNGSGIQSCIHRVYIHRAMAVDRRKARTL